MSDSFSTNGEKRAGSADADGQQTKAKKQKVFVSFDVEKSSVKLSFHDVRNLLLRMFTQEHGENIKWANIRGIHSFQTAVVLMVPCLDRKTVRENAAAAPVLDRLLSGLNPLMMRCATEVQHYPQDQGLNKAACRTARLLLTAKAKRSVKDKKGSTGTKVAEGSAPFPLPIRQYLVSEQERSRSGYPSCKALSPGWASASRNIVCVAGSAHQQLASVSDVAETRGAACEGEDPDQARVFAIDCEMVKTKVGFALARVSLVNWEGDEIFATFVRPEEEVTDYLTEYSGITSKLLDGVTTRVSDVQSRLSELLTEEGILVGHSLECDLQALQFAHEKVIDTALLYPHHSGWPYRHSLAYLSKSYLHRGLDRTNGHNPLEDARTALELAKLKFRSGPKFGIPRDTCVPLGRLLGASRCRLTLLDDGPVVNSPASAWYLEGCDAPTVSEDTGVVEAAAKLCSDKEESGEAPSREVRLVMLRGYETHCEASAAPADGSQHCERTTSCLKELDGHVSRVAQQLAEDELLVLLSPCGDFHQWRGLHAKREAAGADEAQQSNFHKGWGVFSVGGEGLKAKIRGDAPPPLKFSETRMPPRREIVSYDC